MRKTPRKFNKIMPGDVFVRLTVLARIGDGKVSCICACGTKRIVLISNLNRGLTQSCGCLLNEKRAISRITHGACRVPGYTAEYRAWCHVIDRCCNPDAPRYADYGGRGIRICDEWRHDFPAFLAYVGPRPSPKHSIDRWPNNDGDYTPGNVRWAIPDQQNRNARFNRNLTFNGQTRCMTDWATAVDLKPGTLWWRLVIAEWSIEKALTTPRQDIGRRGKSA